MSFLTVYRKVLSKVKTIYNVCQRHPSTSCYKNTYQMNPQGLCPCCHYWLCQLMTNTQLEVASTNSSLPCLTN